MKRFLASALALGIAATSIPSTAEARDGHRSYYSHHHRGDAVAAGVVGLAFGALLGAAIADDNHRRYDRCYDRCGYDRRYDRDGYYQDDYYDGYARPSICVVRERRYDPYSGREVLIEDRRPC